LIMEKAYVYPKTPKVMVPVLRLSLLKSRGKNANLYARRVTAY
jgi:hypothetical protein